MRKDPQLFKWDDLMSKSLIVCVPMHAHTFILSSYRILVYLCLCASIRVYAHAKFICCLLIWERKTEENFLPSNFSLENIFLCLSHIHTQIFAKAISNQHKM